jgi:hypothetical protein
LRGHVNNRLTIVTLTTCGNTERSGLLLNCHRSLFRRHEITWETGPHPARLRV